MIEKTSLYVRPVFFDMPHNEWHKKYTTESRIIDLKKARLELNRMLNNTKRVKSEKALRKHNTMIYSFCKFAGLECPQYVLHNIFEVKDKDSEQTNLFVQETIIPEVNLGQILIKIKEAKPYKDVVKVKGGCFINNRFISSDSLKALDRIKPNLQINRLDKETSADELVNLCIKYLRKEKVKAKPTKSTEKSYINATNKLKDYMHEKK